MTLKALDQSPSWIFVGWGDHTLWMDEAGRTLNERAKEWRGFEEYPLILFLPPVDRRKEVLLY